MPTLREDHMAHETYKSCIEACTGDGSTDVGHIALPCRGPCAGATEAGDGTIEGRVIEDIRVEASYADVDEGEDHRHCGQDIAAARRRAAHHDALHGAAGGVRHAW